MPEPHEAAVARSVHFVVYEPNGERIVPLEAGSAWHIGRNEHSDVVLADDLVSRNHAMLQRTETGEYLLIDMGSRNGSFLNGTRVKSPRTLKDGDSITIGQNVLAFHYPSDRPCGDTPCEDLEEAGTRAYFAPRLISVLVVDIRNFTGLTQQLDQAVLCEMIATWFREGGQIVRAHGSWSQKYIGDAIMATWLHDDPGREAAQILRIIHAYLELSMLTAGLQRRFALPAALGIGGGINTGIASVGNTGTADVTDFTAMGDCVNAAFRIESSTRQVGVDLALGHETCEYLKEQIPMAEYFQPYTVHLKGYDCPCEVLGASHGVVERLLGAHFPV